MSPRLGLLVAEARTSNTQGISMSTSTSARLCSMPGCARKHHALGLCFNHYRQDRNRESQLQQPSESPPICEVDYCPDLAKTAGLCTKHYTNMRRHSTYEAPRPRPTAGRGTGDPVEFIRPKISVTELGCWHFTDWTNSGGYGSFRYGGKSWQAHRWAWVHLAGLELPPQDQMQIDHMCVNPACIRPAHLQLVTAKQNAELRTERAKLLADAEPGSVLVGPNKPRTMDEYIATGRLSPGLIGFPPGAGAIVI